MARMHDEEQLDDAPCDMISDGSAGSLLQCDSNTSIDKARRYEMSCRLAPNKQSPSLPCDIHLTDLTTCYALARVVKLLVIVTRK